MRLDSALKKGVPNISRPKKSRHFRMKLPDNFQMREHSRLCRFHIISTLIRLKQSYWNPLVYNCKTWHGSWIFSTVTKMTIFSKKSNILGLLSKYIFLKPSNSTFYKFFQCCFDLMFKYCHVWNSHLLDVTWLWSPFYFSSPGPKVNF